MNRRIIATTTIVVVVVLSGCVGFPGGGGGPAAADAPGTTTADGTTVDGTTIGATTSSTSTANGTLEIHFINVGQSVSTLLVGPSNETMLLDSGDFRHDGKYVLQYLQRHNVTRIDHLVTSHADADHIGGHAEVIDYFETQADGVGVVYDPGIAASTQTYQDYLDAVEQHNVTLYETRAGDPLRFGGDAVQVDVLGPPEPYLDSRDRNENSIVLRVSHGNASFLFTGDAEGDAEQYLVSTYNDSLRATVLKAGHHGSRTSTSGALLDEVRPRTVVISSANDSQFGHPHNETLRRLSNRTIPTYWTATQGNVVLTSDGDQVRLASQQPAPTRPLSIRHCSAIEPGATWPVTTRAIFDASPASSEGTPTPTATPTATASATATSTATSTATATATATAAPTPTATATPTATPTPTPTATPTATPTPSLALDEVHADAEGSDTDNLNDEYIVLRNLENRTLDMGNWTVEDSVGHTYTVPEGFSLGANETVTLHTGSGTDNATDLYWGSSSPIWNNGGDTVIVTTDEGVEVLREEYS